MSDGVLYLAWTGAIGRSAEQWPDPGDPERRGVAAREEDLDRLMTFDGNDFTSPRIFREDATDRAVSLAASNHEVYVAWKAKGTNYRVYMEGMTKGR